MQFIFSFSSDNFHSRFPFIVGPPSAPDMRWLPTSVRLSSVVRLVLSAGCDRRNMLMTFIVRYVDNTCNRTRKWNKRQASFLS